MTALRLVAVLLAREARVERATRESLVSVVPFVLAGTVLAGLAFGPDPQRLRESAPGLVWLLVLTAAVPLARGVAAAERDDDAWDLLRGLVAPGVLLTAKLAALWAALVLTWGFAALLAVLLLGAPVTGPVVAAGLAGCLGVAGATVVFGALLAGTSRRAGLLAGLVLPAGLPALVAGVQVAGGGPPAPWLALVLAHDAVLLVAAWAVFPLLLEE